MPDRPKLYESQLSETELWERITFLIQEHSRAGLKGYLKKFNYHRRPKTFGRIEGKKFWIWQQGFFSGSIFYPIFHGEILDSHPPIRLEMNSKPNSLGGILFILISIILAIALFIWLLYIQEYDSRREKILSLVLATVVFGAIQFIPNITYTVSKRKFRIFLEKELKLKRIN